MFNEVSHVYHAGTAGRRTATAAENIVGGG